jgi:hypothetical protein
MHQIREVLTYDDLYVGMRVRAVDGQSLIDFHHRYVHNFTKGTVMAKFWGRFWVRWQSDEKGVPWFSFSRESAQFLERVENSPRTRPNKPRSKIKHPK